MNASFHQTLDGSWDELEEYERINRRSRRFSNRPDVVLAKEFLESMVPGEHKSKIPDKRQIEAGARSYYSARRAFVIGATLAAMDGPLPIGDVVAAAFFTGVAVFNAGIALDWW